MAKHGSPPWRRKGSKVHADLENDWRPEIDAVERQIADSERELNTSEGHSRSLPVTRAAFPPAREASGITTRSCGEPRQGPSISRRTA